MSGAETCESDGCEGWPEFPDDDGGYYCRGCYDGDPEFRHVPDEPTGYRTDLISRLQA